MTTRRDTESTTQFIRRRIFHWKTTLAGIAGIVCPLLALFLPEFWALKVLAVSSILSGAGLIAAADGSQVQGDSVTPIRPSTSLTPPNLHRGQNP